VLVIAVSYDVESLNLRIRALEQAGNAVIPASSFESCMNALFTSFHLLIIGASVPHQDRQKLARESRKVRPTAQIISVEWPDSPALDAMDARIPAGDEKLLLETVKRIQYGR